MAIPSQIGRYSISRELGRGGMATVYLGQDPRFGREVAVKVLPVYFHHQRGYRERFENEARIVANLEHASIVPVYDYGDHQGQLYLVMRYMKGGSLRDRLSGAAPGQGTGTAAANLALSFSEIQRILGRLAPALDMAHGRGIIHRDLKPDNVLFDEAGEPFLSDFGIARIAEATQTMTIIGTPAYMSPEQVQGDLELDHRSDLYALGIILFEMLTGRPPYEGDTPTKLMMKHVLEPIPRLRAVAPHLPDTLQAVIDRAMAKDREQRYSSAADLGRATARAMAIPAGPPTRPPVDALPTLPDVPPPPRRTIPEPTPDRPATPPPVAPPTPPPVRPTPPAARPLARRLPVWAWAAGALLLLCLCAGGAALGFGLINGQATPTSEIIIAAAPATDTPALTPTGVGAEATDTTDAGPPATSRPATATAGATEPPGSTAPATVAAPTLRPSPAPTSPPTATRPPPTPSQAPSPTQPPPSSTPTAVAGLSGRLVFTRSAGGAGGTHEIYVLNLATGALSQLTSNGVSDWIPDWSPDGSRIAFSSQRGNTSFDIWTMNGSGGGQSVLIQLPAWDEYADWAPDGSRVVFVSTGDTDGLANSEVFVRESDGRITRVTVNRRADEWPAWSPDGQWIADSSRDEDNRNTDIFLFRPDGGERTQLTSSPLHDEQPDWSPDGAWLAFVRTNRGFNQPGDIWIMRRDGSGARQLTFDGNAADPAWSPDGRYIVFARFRDGNGDGVAGTNDPADLWAVPVGGGDALALLTGPEQDRYPNWAR